MIRLTFITLAALIGAMYIWGIEDPNAPAEEITETVIDNPETPVEAPASSELATLVQAALEGVVEDDNAGVQSSLNETAGDEVSDGPPPKPENNLIVLEADDAPADAPLLVVASAPATASGEDVVGTQRRILEVTGNSVNLRSGPSTRNPVVLALRRGQQAELIGEASGGWLHIRHIETGSEGYMSGSFLRPFNQ